MVARWRGAMSKNQADMVLREVILEHAFAMKYIRSLCQARGIFVTRDEPLHSAFGEYIKSLKKAGLIESDVTERILRASISTLEYFNQVRSDQSLGHDNPILSYDEALLIFNNVTASLRFLRSLEQAIEERQKLQPGAAETLD
jgi:hypothetical protein